MDVSAWLRRLGLDRYEDAFRQNGVDGSVLPRLTPEDLRDLGVAAVGDRRKLIDAITALGQAEAAPPEKGGPTDLAPGERRQVTVMFADLCGFTKLSREIDAEELHAVLGRYFVAVDGIVEGHGGYVDKHVGDCVMAVFGAPVAHGDDAARAVRAAIAVLGAMPGISAAAGRGLESHVGVAAGVVVASGTGSASHRAYTVTGETVNLASRLTDRAPPGSILISEAVRLELGELLELEEHGSISAKGFDEPVCAWRVLAVKDRSAHRPLIGRRAEIAQFVASAEACLSERRGRVVCIRGEAGIGKSRLAQAFEDEAASLGFACHASRVLDFGSRTGHDALRTLLRDLLAIDTGAVEERTQLTRLVGMGLVASDSAVFLPDLLAMDPLPSERALQAAMDMAARAEGRREAIRQIVRHASDSRPRMFICEDIHWADDQLLGDLASIGAAANDCPALLVVTCRPETDKLDHDWRMKTTGTPLTSVDIGPLSLSDARRFAAADSISDLGNVEHCIERAAGNPLFLEQLLRHAQMAVDSQAIPGSVKSLVQSRLDRLAAPDRSVAQAAAILGQMVEPAAVAYLLDWDHAELGPLASQLILRPNEKTWVFHHALVRDAVYEGLLTARRRELHLRASQWYAGREPMLEAEHLDRADDARAVGAYLAAASFEAKAYRHRRALQLAERALAISKEGDSLRADILFLEGELRRELGEMAGASAAYGQALAAASAPILHCRALIGLAEVKRVTDDLDGAWIDLDQAGQIASAEAFVAEEARIHFVRGNLCFPRGDAERCVREHGLSLELARRAGDLALEATALGGLGDGEYMRGRMGRAHEAFDRCVALSEQLGMLRNVAANLPMRSVTSLYTGRVREGLADALAAIAAARSIGHARAEIIAHSCAFLCYASLNDLQSGWPHLSDSLELSRRLGARRFEAEALAMRAEAHRREGKVSEAKRDIADALAISRETGMAYLGPFYLGIQARIAENEKEFRAAIDEAEALLAHGAVSHNHFLFRCDAIDACLERRLFEEADAHAEALRAYASVERSARVDFFWARARALAAAGRGRADMAELERLIRQGTDFGFLSALGELEVALGRAPGQ